MINKKHKVLIISTGIILLIACLIPVFWFVFSQQKQGGILKLADYINLDENEPTPFQPFQLTSTPPRDIQPITSSLVPVGDLVPPEGQVNILLLGSDWRPNSGYRTDVILLISIFTRESKVSLLSFPRDLWVEIPGRDEDRINTAMVYGGFPLLAQTFERNFAIPVDYYMMTNFYGFQSIIDTLGGIDIEASKNTADRCDLSYQHGAWCSIGPGQAHLDGELALWYVRSRYTSSDFDRTRRAQEVTSALFKKLMSLDAVSKAPELYNLFINSVETNITLNDLISLLPVAPSIFSDLSRVKRLALGTEQVTPYTIPGSGASVLLPNYDAIWQIIQEAIYTP